MKRPSRVLLAACCLLAGTACARKPANDVSAVFNPTVYVVNAGQNALRVYVVYGNLARFLGTVQPGERRCFPLPFPNETYNLAARNLEGHAVSPSFQPSTAGGWLWELGISLNQDEISLRPIDEPCK